LWVVFGIEKGMLWVGFVGLGGGETVVKMLPFLLCFWSDNNEEMWASRERK